MSNLQRLSGRRDHRLLARPQTARCKNLNSGLRLVDTHWATADASTLQQWTCNGLAVQQWRLADVGAGQVNIVSRSSNICLDDYNFQTADGFGSPAVDLQRPGRPAVERLAGPAR